MNHPDKDLKEEVNDKFQFQFSPEEFKVNDSDPEQTLERFELYLEGMQKAFRLNRRVNPTTGAKGRRHD